MTKIESVVHVVGILFFHCLSSEVDMLVEWIGVEWIHFSACWGGNLMQQVLCAVCGDGKWRCCGRIPGYVWRKTSLWCMLWEFYFFAA